MPLDSGRCWRGSVESQPPNQRLELTGRTGRGSVDHLIDREAEVETTNSFTLAGRPQLKRGR